MIHPVWVRITHWINAVAMLMMIMSGLARSITPRRCFHFTFPNSITLGGWLAGALLWHFAAMWLLASMALSTSCSVSPPAAFAANSCRSVRREVSPTRRPR